MVGKKNFHVFYEGRLRWGTGGARIAFHTELFPFLLFSESTSSGIVDMLVHKKCYIKINKSFSGGKLPELQIGIMLLGHQKTTHCSSGTSLKTKLYHCGGTYTFFFYKKKVYKKMRLKSSKS